MRKEKTLKRRDEILEAAVEILINEGHAALSMDKVAKTLNISKGNITYHFPNKKSFVQAVFSYLMTESQDNRSVSFDPYESSLEKRLKRYLENEFEILLRPKHDSRVWETLAYSTHDDIVGLAFEKLFDWHIEQVVQILAPLRPDLSRKNLQNLAILILSITRGLLVFIGSSRHSDEREGLRTQAIHHITFMVKSWGREDELNNILSGKNT